MKKHIQGTLCAIVLGLAVQFQPFKESVPPALPSSGEPSHARSARRRFPVPDTGRKTPYNPLMHKGAMYERSHAQCYSSCGRY